MFSTNQPTFVFRRLTASLGVALVVTALSSTPAAGAFVAAQPTFGVPTYNLAEVNLGAVVIRQAYLADGVTPVAM